MRNIWKYHRHRIYNRRLLWLHLLKFEIGLKILEVCGIPKIRVGTGFRNFCDCRECSGFLKISGSRTHAVSMFIFNNIVIAFKTRTRLKTMTIFNKMSELKRRAFDLLKFSEIPNILGNPGTFVIANIFGIPSRFPEKIPISRPDPTFSGFCTPLLPISGFGNFRDPAHLYKTYMHRSYNVFVANIHTYVIEISIQRG